MSIHCISLLGNSSLRNRTRLDNLFSSVRTLVSCSRRKMQVKNNCANFLV